MNPITRKEAFLAAAGGQSVNTPKPITREEMFLQRIAENSEAGGGVSSWNDLTDKPFYEEIVETELASGEYTSALKSDYGAYSIDFMYTDETEEIPESVTITLDGVVYENLTVINIPQLSSFCGNLSILNSLLGTSYENTGEPFVCGLSADGASIFLLDTEPTSHNMKFVAPVRVTHGVSPEFISIPTFNLTEMGLPGIPNDGTTVTTDADTSALFRALKKGCVRLRFMVGFTEVTGVVYPSYVRFGNSCSCHLVFYTNTIFIEVYHGLRNDVLTSEIRACCKAWPTN